MKYFLTMLTGVFLTISAFGQTLTPIYFPQYMQASGGSGTDRVPYICRFAVSGLRANTTYRYVNHFATNPSDGWLSGASIFIRPNGEYVRVEYPDLYDLSVCGELTTDASGSYTGWFINEPDFGTPFTPGQVAYFRLLLNDGNDGFSWETFVSSQETVTMINFNGDVAGGTAIRSTPAAKGVAKNFVMFYDNPNGTGRPISGSFVEDDGTDNSTNTFYADFYANNVNGVDKAWGTIIPNNLVGGIKRIAQYSLVDGTEVGFKTSADGLWAKDGGGTVSTVNTTGGLTDVIVLDGTRVPLGVQPQTITFNALLARTYGEGDFDPGATASSGLAVTYTSSNPAVATIVNNMIHIVGAGTTNITAEQPGNTDYSAASPVTQRFTVNPAALTITAADKTKVQGDPLPALTVSYSGFVNGDDETKLSSPVVVTTTAVPSSPPGIYPITPAGAAANNYTISYINGTLTVFTNQQAQTITFQAFPPKKYGDIDFDPGAIVNSPLEITYTSSDPAVAALVDGKLHIMGAGTTVITASQAGNATFSPAADVTQTLTVAKAALTISADNKTRTRGQPNPDLTITYTGLVNNETPSVLTAQPVISTTATLGSPVGNYPINVSGAAAANYEITHVNGTLSVNPLQVQTITFHTLPAMTYGAADFDHGITVSSGLPLTFTSSDPSVAAFLNGKIRITGTGTAIITAAQEGNGDYDPAAPVSRTLIVNKAPLTVTAEDKSRIVGHSNPVLTLIYSGFVNNETSSSLIEAPVAFTAATLASPAGTYPITVSGGVAANYTFSYEPGTLTVQPLMQQTIQFNALSTKKYGDAPFSPGATASSGLAVQYQSSNPQVALIENGTIRIMGAGTADITASQPGDDSNAPAASVTRTLSVNKALLEIRANNLEKRQGEVNPPLTATYTGLVSGDTEASLSTPPVLSTTATTRSLSGIYTIQISGATSPDYQIAQLSGTLTILPQGGSSETTLNVYMSGPTQLRVNFHAATAGDMTLQLFDISGNRVLQKQLNAAAAANTWYFEIGNLPPGVYLVRLSGGTVVLKAKVLKG